LETGFSKGLQFFVAKSHAKISRNNMAVPVKTAKDAWPFFIKSISSAIITIVITTSMILPVVSRFRAVNFKCKLPIKKGKIRIPDTILKSKFKPKKKARTQSGKV
jgi:hypothetical protein